MIKHPLLYKMIMFDADGTLRRCTVPGQPCPNNPGEWELMPNVKETLARYDLKRIGLYVVSNQGGIALGYLTETMALDLIYDLCEQIDPDLPHGRYAAYICPHSPNDGCPCRKPSPYLLLQVLTQEWDERKYFDDYDPPKLSECLYVGDQDTDRQTAERAGIAFMWANDFFGWDTP